jgi:hypothetical protein
LILYAMISFDHRTRFPGLSALVPTIGAALVIAAAVPTTWAGKLLGSKPLVAAGLISYSAYLWHQPLLAFARLRSLWEPSHGVALLLCAGVVGLACLSWRFVERPFRMAGAFSRRQVFTFAGIASALFLALGTLGMLSDGYRQLYEARLDTRQKAIFDGFVGRAQQAGPCVLTTSNLGEQFAQRFASCAEKHQKAVVLLGDSHAMDLYPALAGDPGQPFVVNLSQGGCRPGSAKHGCHYDEFLHFAAAHRTQIRVVIYTQAGHRLVRDESGGEGTRESFRRSDHPMYQPDLAGIEKVVGYLNAVRAFAPAVWVGSRLEPHVNAGVMLRRALDCKRANIRVADPTVRTFSRLDATVRERMKREPALTYVSGMEAIAMDDARDLYDCSAVYWSDQDHWSSDGEQRFGPRIVAALRARGLF